MERLPQIQISHCRFQRALQSQIQIQKANKITDLPLFFPEIKDEHQAIQQISVKSEKVKRKGCNLKICSSSFFQSQVSRFNVKNDTPGPYALSREINGTKIQFSKQARFQKIQNSVDYPLFDLQRDQISHVLYKAGVKKWKKELSLWTDIILKNIDNQEKEQQIVYFQSDDKLELE
ncbi:hypothetical protein SS50377_25498 [Spironucleus salmonicida]|uniref:Uncharacterized protein n=1 Tax=Spironucleus salmonicida TaxID=348837 RepID=V6LK91_9EUKA|nr:hypothetical protein SS50377_25498 [Spironucleus salmonicida]|eukprot:EST45045.1 Hypothetical protein SS50377_15064 [Spironucleus salmonicida]